MGFGWQELLIILVIVGLIFGTSKLRNMGSDLGGAVKGFKKGLKENTLVATVKSHTHNVPTLLIEHT